MTNHFNTIVVGLGAMGSSAIYQMAKRNISVLGIDRFCPPHTLGSTHGETRITRQAIGEGEHYTPLAVRSYEIFREVEERAHTKLLEVTGGLIISSDAKKSSINQVADFLDNTIAAAQKHGIRHEILEAKDIRRKFPQFNVDDDEVGYYEYEAAFLRPEIAVRSQLDLAQTLGATVHTGETFQSFEEIDRGVTVRTDQNTYTAEHLVLSIGPWLPETLTELDGLFKIHRQVLYWFDISAAFDDFVPGKFPVFIWLIKNSEHGIYGFPAVDGPNGGIKIASEEYVDTTTPASINRNVSLEETADMFKRNVAPSFPQVGAPCVKSATCLYTVTRDSEFVIDWLPSSQRVIVCSPCSGHGFKHSAAIGECLAELVSVGQTKLDISAFKLDKARKVAEMGRTQG